MFEEDYEDALADWHILRCTIPTTCANKKDHEDCDACGCGSGYEPSDRGWPSEVLEHLIVWHLDVFDIDACALLCDEDATCRWRRPHPCSVQASVI